MEHEKIQAQERELAGDLWHESDFMFTQPNGKPIDPRSDHNEWKALLSGRGSMRCRRDLNETAARRWSWLYVGSTAVLPGHSSGGGGI